MPRARSVVVIFVRSTAAAAAAAAAAAIWIVHYPRSLHHDIRKDRNLITRSPRRAFTTAFAETKTLPQAPAEPSPRHLPRQNLARSLHHGSCPDKNLTTSTRGAFTTAFARTKTLPQVAAEPSPRHLQRQKPYNYKHPRSLHHGICQDKNLTTSSRGAFTTAFAKTTTLPQAPAEPSPRHLQRQKPYNYKHPRSLHHGICQDKNLTTSSRGAFTTVFAKTKTFTTSTCGSFTVAYGYRLGRRSARGHWVFFA